MSRDIINVFVKLFLYGGTGYVLYDSAWFELNILKESYKWIKSKRN